VQWLYRDAKVGAVSEVFDLQDAYVVAVMTGEVEEGYKPLQLVRSEITTPVQNKLKAAKIIEKLKGLNGTLDEMAASFGKDGNVYSNSGVRLNTNTLTSVGFDPKVVGRAFSLEGGKRSEPIQGENGVVIIELQNKTIAPDIGDYTTYQDQLVQSLANRTSFNIGDAIKENSNIEDKRYRFY
jgi:peptidyl-prolyl cis-trans isomerase D